MTDDPTPATLEALLESLRGLHRLYEEVGARCEVLRILGVSRGLWTQAEFDDGVATLLARGREAAARDVANADPSRRAAQSETLRQADPDPQ